MLLLSALLATSSLPAPLPACSSPRAQEDAAHASADVPWGGFRGNNGCGVAREASLPVPLDLERHLRWRTEVPAGYSSPVVAAGRVFLTGAEGSVLVTLALDQESGKLLWASELEYDGERPGANSPAAPSPVTDGERVVSLFHGFGALAHDMEGELLWEKPLGPFNIPHGLATSPVLHGDTVVLQIDQDTGSYLLALDAASGEERWRVERPGTVHGYATPAVHVPAEGPAQVVVSSSFQLAGFSIEDGEKLWWVDGAAWQTKAVPVIEGQRAWINASMVGSGEIGLPRFSQTWEEVLAERDADGDGALARSEWDHEMLQQTWFIWDLDGDDLLGPEDWRYAQASATAQGGLFAVDLTGRGDVTESHVRWMFDERRSLPDAPSPVLVDGVLFLLGEGGILTSIDAGSGEVIERGRIGEPDAYFASPIVAGDVLLASSRGGQLVQVRARGEWEELAAVDLEEQVWSTPALAGGRVYVRSQKAVYCLGEE